MTQNEKCHGHGQYQYQIHAIKVNDRNTLSPMKERDGKFSFDISRNLSTSCSVLQNHYRSYVTIFQTKSIAFNLRPGRRKCVTFAILRELIVTLFSIVRTLARGTGRITRVAKVQRRNANVNRATRFVGTQKSGEIYTSREENTLE